MVYLSCDYDRCFIDVIDEGVREFIVLNKHAVGEGLLIIKE